MHVFGVVPCSFVDGCMCFAGQLFMASLGLELSNFQLLCHLLHINKSLWPSCTEHM